MKLKQKTENEKQRLPKFGLPITDLKILLTVKLEREKKYFQGSVHSEEGKEYQTHPDHKM